MDKKPDRYTVLWVQAGDLQDYLEAVQKLDLTAVVMASPESSSLRLYVFFDAAGCAAYFSGLYGSVVDSLRAGLVDFAMMQKPAKFFNHAAEVLGEAGRVPVPPDPPLYVGNIGVREQQKDEE